MWVDADYDSTVGSKAFLVETTNTSNGVTTWGLQDSPLRTNQSHEPRLSGWCGETNNRSRYARGLVEIVRLSVNGERCLVRQVTGAELREALEQFGHPELATA